MVILVLTQKRSHHIRIIISEKDYFDYSSGEPPLGVDTVLRMLEVISVCLWFSYRNIDLIC